MKKYSVLRRTSLLLFVLAFIVSLVAPSGAAFALEEQAVVANEQLQSVEPKLTPQPVEQASETSSEIVSSPLPAQETTVTSTQSAPILVTPPAAATVIGPETAPPLIVMSLQVSSTVEIVELYNQSDSLINLDEIRLQTSDGLETCTLTATESGWVLPKSFVSLRSPTAIGQGLIPLSGDCAFADTITRIEVFNGESRLQLIDGIAPTSSWLRHKSTVTSTCAPRVVPATLKQTGSATNDYLNCSASPNLGSDDLYTPPVSEGGLRIVEIMSDSRSCAPSDGGTDCFDFVKVKNVSGEPVNLAEFRLRTGASTSSATSSNTFYWHQTTIHPERDELLLLPGDFFTVTKRGSGEPLSLTNGNGNVWLEDYYGIRSYQAVSYQSMDLAAAKGKSWIQHDSTNVWQFGIPSPNQATNLAYIPPQEGGKGEVGSSLKPCREDQYRSEETNRCRTITAISNALAPCREGQYRSEETNRCRSIASAAASVLKPCRDDQFRNPATNRCKSIASSEDLADCGEGRERNPTTNRCRNVTGSLLSASDIGKVQATKDTPMMFAGWWIIGIIGLLGVGYMGWEWRHELGRLIGRIGQFFSGAK